MQSLELCNPPEKGAEGPLLAIHRSASGRPLVGLLSHHGDINDASKAAIGLVLDAARLYHLCAWPDDQRAAAAWHQCTPPAREWYAGLDRH